MARTTAPAAAPMIPSFAPVANDLLAAVRVQAEAQDSYRVRINELFDGYITRLIAAGIPKCDASSRAIRKSFNAALDESIEWINAFESGDYRRSTFNNYCTSMILCWAAGIPFKASAFLSADKGGIKRPKWWAVKAHTRGTKVTAPSAASTVNPETVETEATQLLGHVRAIHGDDAADQLLDALMSAIPGFKVRA